MLEVTTIKNGIVIDHIKSGLGIKIFNYLKLDKADFSVALIMNADSKKLHKKDLIKIENVMDVDITALGLMDSNITVNLIKDEVIQEKIKLNLPEEIEGIIECKNPRCITTNEQYVPHAFYLSNAEKGEYRCKYCDEIYSANDILF